MNSNPSVPDAVAAFAFIGGIVFANPQLAQVIAPYATIFFFALIGALWCLSRKPTDADPGHRMRGGVLLMKVVGAALAATIPLAVWSAPKLDIEQHRYLYAPISFIIGAVGDDWKPFLIWCRDFILRWKSGTPET